MKIFDVTLFGGSTQILCIRSRTTLKIGPSSPTTTSETVSYTQSKIFLLNKLIILGTPKCLFVRCLLVLVLRHIRHNVAEFLTIINDIPSLHHHEMKSIHYIVKVDYWFNLQTNNDESQGLFEKMTVCRLLDIQLIPPPWSRGSHYRRRSC